MPTKILKGLWHLRNWLRGDYAGSERVFGQYAEDFLMLRAFSENSDKAVRELRYLDIGANHPTRLSNTMLFYLRGASGVLVEPDPRLAQELRKRRPRDTVIESGIAGSDQGSLAFHLMEPDVLNTFSESELNGLLELGYKKVGEISISVVGVGTVIGEHFDQAPDIFSLNVEGLDEEIIRAIDWGSFRPLVVCVETWDMAYRREKPAITEILENNGYGVFAKAGPNTIFQLK